MNNPHVRIFTGMTHEQLVALPKNAVEARREESTYFYTGKACVNGHKAARYTINGLCTYCVRNRESMKNSKERAAGDPVMQARHKLDDLKYERELRDLEK